MKPIDWTVILEELAFLLGEPDPIYPPNRTPLGSRALATALSVDRSAIRRWQEGTEPGHFEGERLLARWCSLTNRDRAFAPRSRSCLSASQMR